MVDEQDLINGTPSAEPQFSKDVSPISLYFGFSKGHHADLEIVARAAIEWVAIIREIASVVAPGVQFEVDLV